MHKKIIVFDVDGVITSSWSQKDLITQEVLTHFWLLHLPWVQEILDKKINRILMVEEIYALHPIFHPSHLLEAFNSGYKILEDSAQLIVETDTFIKKYHGEYFFFTNTAMPKQKLIRIFERFEYERYFEELLAYDDGTKRENIEYILRNYDAHSQNILFIDDNQVHIDAVSPTWVHTLLFCDDWVSLEENIGSIFGK